MKERRDGGKEREGKKGRKNEGKGGRFEKVGRDQIKLLLKEKRFAASFVLYLLCFVCAFSFLPGGW